MGWLTGQLWHLMHEQEEIQKIKAEHEKELVELRTRMTALEDINRASTVESMAEKAVYEAIISSLEEQCVLANRQLLVGMHARNI
jgi:hypothetical protein